LFSAGCLQLRSAQRYPFPKPVLLAEIKKLPLSPGESDLHGAVASPELLVRQHLGLCKGLDPSVVCSQASVLVSPLPAHGPQGAAAPVTTSTGSSSSSSSMGTFAPIAPASAPVTAAALTAPSLRAELLCPWMRPVYLFSASGEEKTAAGGSRSGNANGATNTTASGPYQLACGPLDVSVLPPLLQLAHVAQLAAAARARQQLLPVCAMELHFQHAMLLAQREAVVDRCAIALACTLRLRVLRRRSRVARAASAEAPSDVRAAQAQVTIIYIYIEREIVV
jgi:hypothetical protein